MYIEVIEDYRREGVSLGSSMERLHVTSEETTHTKDKMPYSKRIRPHIEALVKEYQAMNNMVRDANPGNISKVADEVVVTFKLLP